MPTTLAFDVYGTLIDTQGVVAALRNTVGIKAEDFSRSWREKQLEYTFRRGLMQNYENLAVCTRHALDYTCSYYQVALNAKQKTELLEIYRILPAFKEVKEVLARLAALNFRLYAFSNGTDEAVNMLLASAGIRDFFLKIISVDDIKSFKPNPSVYNYFLKSSGATLSNAWLISSNPFDVIGGISAGMQAVWLKRYPKAIFDPWGIEPSITITSLADLEGQLTKHQ